MLRLTPLRTMTRTGAMLSGDQRVEGGAAPDELVVRQLPERLAGEQAGLHDLGHPLAPLLCGERLEEGRVDHGARGPVERADEVLTLRQVDGGLATNRRVDLRDEA